MRRSERSVRPVRRVVVVRRAPPTPSFPFPACFCANRSDRTSSSLQQVSAASRLVAGSSSSRYSTTFLRTKPSSTDAPKGKVPSVRSASCTRARCAFRRAASTVLSFDPPAETPMPKICFIGDAKAGGWVGSARVGGSAIAIGRSNPALRRWATRRRPANPPADAPALNPPRATRTPQPAASRQKGPRYFHADRYFRRVTPLAWASPARTPAWRTRIPPGIQTLNPVLPPAPGSDPNPKPWKTTEPCLE